MATWTVSLPVNPASLGVMKVADVQTALVTDGSTTAVQLNIPANSFILGVTAQIVTPIAGVSTTDVTVAAALTGGSTAAVGNFVASGNGNVAAGTTVSKMIAAAVTAETDAAVTISGGVDNTPSAGSVRIVAHYFVPPAL